MRDIIVYGAGGHGKVVCEAALSKGHEVIAFIDDRRRDPLLGRPVIDFETYLTRWKATPVALGIGDNQLRQRLHARLRAAGVNITTIVHNSAILSPSCRIGEGVVVMAGAIVNAEAKVSEGVIINTSALIEHDCSIAPYVHVSPKTALAGNVTVGELSHIGIGSTVIQGVCIGKNTIIAAGSTVIGPLPDNIMAAGTPAIVKKELA